jgi:elongation factor P
MAMPATQMRPGMIIKFNNELHTVFAVEHRTPGNLRAFIQAKLRYYFMDTTTYEQTNLKRDTIGDAVEYLTSNLQITVSIIDGVPVGIDLPQIVELTVIETEPGLKSATASSVTKPARLETGLMVNVPAFINEGEKIRVDTAEGVYLSRA